MTPNVATADTSEEIEALMNRYQQVRTTCNEFVSGLLDEFEAFVSKTYVSINLAIETLHRVIVENEPYKNYHELREMGINQFNLTREQIDERLFGSDAKNIRYGALCAQSPGLRCYGACCMVLNGAALQNCASLFEENTFAFFDARPGALEKIPCDIPLGYRATWENRGKLAVAKLGHHFATETPTDDFNEVLICSTTQKMTDNFVEVHICKTIGKDDIVEMRLPKNLPQQDENDKEYRRELKKSRKMLSKLEEIGKSWTLYD
jgi:hypothetical protein